MGLGWQYRIQLISLSLSQLAVDYQVTDLKYRIDEIDFSHTRIPILAFKINQPTRVISVQATQLDFRYTVDQLKNARVGETKIAKLIVNINSTARHTTDATDATDDPIHKPINISDIIDGISKIGDFSIPVETINIENLRIIYDGFDLTAQHPVKLTANSTTHSANPAKTEIPKIDISLIQKNLLFNLSYAKQVWVAELKNNLSQQISYARISTLQEEPQAIRSVSGLFNFNLEHLFDYWSEINNTQIKSSLSGEFKLDFSAHKTDDDWRVKTNVIGQNITIAETNISRSEFDLILLMPNSLDAKTIEFNIIPKSKLSMENFHSAEFSIESVSYHPSGIVKISSDPHDSLISYAISASSDSPTAISLQNITGNQYRAEMASLMPIGDIDYTDDQLNANLLPGTEIKFHGLSINNADIDIQSAALTSAGLIAISQVNTETGNTKATATIKNGNWLISQPSFITEALNITAATISVSTELDSTGKVNLGLNGKNIKFDTNHPGTELDISEFNSVISGKASVFDISGDIFVAQYPVLWHYHANINTDSGITQYSLNQDSPLEISSHSEVLNKQISYWAPELSLSDGQLELEITGKWSSSEELSNKIELSSANISGSYEDVDFSGASINGPVFYPPDNAIGSATINLQRVEYGAEVENIATQIRLSEFNTGEKPGAIFSHLTGETLGSQFEITEFIFDPNSGENHFDLFFTGLDIDQVVNMQNIEGLSATGKLNGKLPISISKSGVNIALGEIWNQQDGGTIQYLIDPEQAKSLTNPLTDTVLSALEEFHYDLLTATADFEPDGNLQVNFHIEGKSPKLDTNQPVHLNINSEQNVISLLQSLKYANDIGEEINAKTLRAVTPTATPE